MSSVSKADIKREFAKSRLGIIGLSILGILIAVSVIAIISVPTSTFQDWNNPEKWLGFPKTSVPIWVNYFTSEKIPEHKILESETFQSNSDHIYLTSDQFVVNYQFDDFPSDFVYEFQTEYSDSYLITINLIRPDGKQLELLTTSLPHSENKITYKQRIFSTDEMIKKNLLMTKNIFGFDISEKNATEIIFSELIKNKILKGEYTFVVNMYGINNHNQIIDSNIILGGKAFGLMGTDELRRDLAVGLLWGTPLALFIGVTVSIGSVSAGLIYGVYSGYKGKIIDESMMRFNDVIYALPALPFLIILAVTISNSIFLMLSLIHI